MYTQTVLVFVLAALAEARFGQEQVPISAISAVTSGGESGQAATLAGESISTLLGAADPCAKLAQADKIIATLGTGDDAVAAAKGLVAAEQNFNNFVTDKPNICADASLPATEILRGIVPLVDPAVTGSDTENANSASSIDNPFDAAGLSVADIMAANGFTNFNTPGGAKAAAGGNANAGAGDAATGGDAAAGNDAKATDAPVASAAPAAAGCPTTLVTVTRKAAAPTAVANDGAGAGNNNGTDAGNNNGAGAGNNNGAGAGNNNGADAGNNNGAGAGNNNGAGAGNNNGAGAGNNNGAGAGNNNGAGAGNNNGAGAGNNNGAGAGNNNGAGAGNNNGAGAGNNNGAAAGNNNGAGAGNNNGTDAGNNNGAGAGNNNGAGAGNNNGADAGNNNGAGAGNNNGAGAGNNNGAANGGAATGGADFGLCTPTILRAGGLGGRPADEFTFQATDPLVSKGQQEALNPNIITNRICDQLTNVCEANDAAKALCLDAKAQVLDSGLRDASVVTLFNGALGF